MATYFSMGIRDFNSYEGQAALELEMAIAEGTDFSAYPFELQQQDNRLIFNPDTCIRAIVDNVLNGTPAGLISGRFHTTLARMMVEVCRIIRKESGVSRVVLSGGVFQNRFLTEKAVGLLTLEGFAVLTHALVPPNDGGLSLGQAAVAGQHR